MTVGNTDRFGLTTWDSGSDQFTRVQMNTSHILIDDQAAGFVQGDKPTAGPEYKGFFHYSSDAPSTSAGILSYCNGEVWFPISEAANDVTLIGESGVIGISDAYAREDHVHALAPGVVDAGALGEGAVIEAKIFNGAVTRDKILDGEVIYSKIQNVAGSSVMGRSSTAGGPPTNITATSNGLVLRRSNNVLEFGQISETELGEGSVTASKVNSSVAGSGLVKNGTSGALDVSVDGATLEINDDTLRIKNSGVTNDKIASMDGGKITGEIPKNAFFNVLLEHDGAGSGLDADKLDGLNSSSFVRSDTSDTMSGNLTITGTATVGSTRPVHGIEFLTTPVRVMERTISQSSTDYYHTLSASLGGSIPPNKWLKITFPSSIEGITVDNGVRAALIELTTNYQTTTGGYIAIAKYSSTLRVPGNTNAPTWSNHNWTAGQGIGSFQWVALEPSDRSMSMWINTSSTSGNVLIDIIGFTFAN